MDFAAARQLMVETQVRTADVTDPAILAAMRALPREAFAPPARKLLAYSDSELEVAPGRTLLRPRDLAKLLQAVAPRRTDRALEIAGATGYGTALLAQICEDAVLLEPDSALNFAAVAAFGACGVTGAHTASTDIAAGWPDLAPYDVIILNGAAEVVPDAWLTQLAEGGRLGVIVRDGPAGHARVYTKARGVTAYRVVFDAAPPVAPGLAAVPTFSF
ncbi:MAG: protein-L-isoaspartate O-methyltransferase [Hyphomonadaceae bacterium]|nr:protein-L-isoaspartate O-methyltransferase [Hyphomonadaceae bacterium]